MKELKKGRLWIYPCSFKRNVHTVTEEAFKSKSDLLSVYPECHCWHGDCKPMKVMIRYTEGWE